MKRLFKPETVHPKPDIGLPESLRKHLEAQRKGQPNTFYRPAENKSLRTGSKLVEPSNNEEQLDRRS
jgi:hypothetical protein